MKRVPLRCVVDTNVAKTANGANAGASLACVEASARALQILMSDGHIFIDDRGLILGEYRRNLSGKGEPGLGDAFLKWLLTHEWGGRRVTRVPIRPKPGDEDSFEELPQPEDGTVFDRSDRKFLAVAAAHQERPPVLQSFDSKWWGWQSALEKLGVKLHFLCASEIRKKHREKMGR